MTSYIILVLLLKNDILFSITILDQGPDHQCLRSSPRLSIQVGSVYCLRICCSTTAPLRPWPDGYGESAFCKCLFQ